MKINRGEFLRLKIDVYSRMFEAKASREGFAQMFCIPLEELIRKKRVSKSTALRIERDIEGFVHDLVQKDKIKEARIELRKLIGFDNLSAPIDAKKIVKRVLHRRRISDDSEAEIVRNFVSNLSNEALIGKTAFDRLAKVLEMADY